MYLGERGNVLGTIRYGEHFRVISGVRKGPNGKDGTIATKTRFWGHQILAGGGTKNFC